MHPILSACRSQCPRRTQGAATDARVFIEMFAPHDPTGTSGDLRLLDIDTHAKPFARDAVDLFVVGRRAMQRDPNSW